MRLIVLKARQLGVSTITESLLFSFCFVYNRANSLIVTQESEATHHLFSMSKLMWETYPFRGLFTEKYNSKHELTWAETGSTIRVATAAKQGSLGRGRTINFCHLSEVAFWPDPVNTMLGLRQTIPELPNTMMVIESTANGVGNWFYEEWERAEAGESEFIPLFFPWWQHPEYTASFAGVTMDVDLPDSEELWLRTQLGVDDDHLAWRRWAITNLAGDNLDSFHQEYPSTPEEAFLRSGTNAFNLDKLRQCYEPMEGLRGHLTTNLRTARVEFVPNARGPLTIYRSPAVDRDWGMYFVGGDPAHAGGQDYACAQVINRRTYEQVATWHGHIDPINFGDELAKLARYYNDAEISVEVTGPGMATISRLISLEYPFLWRHQEADRTPGVPKEIFGWASNWQRKDWAISELHKLVLDGSLTLHDRMTFGEMRAFILLPEGTGYGPAELDGHDDTVMSLAIAVVCSRTSGPLLPYENREFLDEMEPPAWAEWQDALT